MSGCPLIALGSRVVPGKLSNSGGTFANELLLNGSELLFEAGEVLVERPHKGLVRPEGGFGALFGGRRGRGGHPWGTGLGAVPCHLIDEALEPGDSLPVCSDVLQHGTQAVLETKTCNIRTQRVWGVLEHKAMQQRPKERETPRTKVTQL